MILRRGYIIFFSLLLLNSQYGFCQQKLSDLAAMERVPVFRETFDSNTNNWITNNDYVFGRFEKGHFILKCKNFNGTNGLSYKLVKLDQNRDFEIESSLEIIKGTGGLLFGMNGKYDHYRVEITDKNDLVIIENSNSKKKIEKLLTITNSPLIKVGNPVKITVRKLGNIYSIFVNDSPVKEFSDIKPEGDQIGFNVGVNSEVSVDYLNVSYLQKQTSPVLTEKNTDKKDTTKITSPSTNVIPAPGNINRSVTSTGTPEIAWTTPTKDTVTLTETSRYVKARVRSSSKLSQVLFNVNGKSLGEGSFSLEPGVEGSYLVEMLIDFKSGLNTVFFTVTNENKESKQSEFRYLINPIAVKPIITWTNPSTNSTSGSDRIMIEACIKSPSSLVSVDVLVNGDSRGKDRVFEKSSTGACDYIYKRFIDLKEGIENKVTIIAENEAGSNDSDPIKIIYSKAITEKRLALVIGNSRYNNKQPLKNPENDANLMAGTLQSLDFKVIKKTNLGLDSMETVIRQFSRMMRDYNVVLFYFAGHGVQVDGQNYLLPIDAKLEKREDCSLESYSVNLLMEEFQKYPNNINIAILDACRNNPFTNWSRGGEAVFVPITKTNGTFISFATGPGTTAADGTSANGLFTEELVHQLNIVQSISSVFLKTRVNVWERSNHKQRPQEWNDLNGDFYFKKQ